MLLLNKKKEIIGSIEEELLKCEGFNMCNIYNLENAKKVNEILESSKVIYLIPEVGEEDYGSINELSETRIIEFSKILNSNIQFLSMIKYDSYKSRYLEALSNPKKNKTTAEVPLIKPVTYDNPFRYIKNMSNPFEDKITHINHDIHSQMTRPSHPGDINESCYYNNQSNLFCNNDNKIDEETDLLGLSKNLNDLLVVESACLYDTKEIDMVSFTDNDGDEINMKYKDLSIMYKEDGDNNNIYTIVNGIYKINLTLSKDRILYVSRKDSTIFINIICK